MAGVLMTTVWQTLPNGALAWLAAHCVHLADQGTTMMVGVAQSNLVSEVAVMLLLPHVQGVQAQSADVPLALVSAFGGHLLWVGSIANAIVANLARQIGIAIDGTQHACADVLVTVERLALPWGAMHWIG